MGYLGGTPNLSPATWRVLALVAAGLGAGAIAARLACDRDAVRRHLAEAIAALSAHSVPDAVRIAIRRGLIEPPTT